MKIVKFKELSNRLWVSILNNLAFYEDFLMLNPSKSCEGLRFASAMTDNMKCFSKAMKKRVSRARKSCIASDALSADSFKVVTCMNLIRDNPAMTEDIQLAEKGYGSELGSAKGKTARSKPTPVMSQKIEIPEDLLRVNIMRPRSQ